jgi:23S rRNA (uracil1939-C5)-methyltransferase
MVHGGGCLTRDDSGAPLMVSDALPDELVDVELTRRRGGLWWARTVAVVEASPHRVEPPCPYVPECGGCDVQHVAYGHQLELKRQVVVDALHRQHVDIPDAVGVHGMETPWRYRWRGEFHVVPGAAGTADAALGFNRARSHRPIAVDDCLIHHPTITGALPALRDAVRQGATPELTVLHLTAGSGGDELLVRPKPARAMDAAVIDSAALAFTGAARWMTDATTLHWRSRSFRVTAETFIQVNQEQMEILYSCILDDLGDISGLRLVDAYAGVGMLACVLGERAASVVCIEANRNAARLGVLNSRLNGVDERVEYLAKPVESALAEVAAASPIDAVVLDPPRAGCSGGVTGWLALTGPARVVYVSCDPATLARDLHLMVASGPYVVERLDVVDMFPQTHHVEVVASLRRGG